jgi:hypothetical protein
MKVSRYLCAGLGLLLILAIGDCTSAIAFAQEAIVTPGGAAVVPEGSEIVVPWGAWLSELSSILATLLGAIVLWLFRRLPGSVTAILQTMRAEQLIQRAIDYGLNATAGAAKDKVLTVQVGNEVVAKAVAYAIDNGAPYVIRWLGGTDGLVQKIVARLDLEPDAEIDASSSSKLPLTGGLVTQ